MTISTSIAPSSSIFSLVPGSTGFCGLIRKHHNIGIDYAYGPDYAYVTSPAREHGRWDVGLPANWSTASLRKHIEERGIKLPTGIKKAQLVRIYKDNFHNTGGGKTTYNQPTPDASASTVRTKLPPSPPVTRWNVAADLNGIATREQQRHRPTGSNLSLSRVGVRFRLKRVRTMQQRRNVICPSRVSPPSVVWIHGTGRRCASTTKFRVGDDNTDAGDYRCTTPLQWTRNRAGKYDIFVDVGCTN